MSDNVALTAPTVIKLEQLATTGAISALGLVAARMLQQHGIVCLMVGSDGAIEVVPVIELEMDTLDEPDALVALIKRDYTNDQLAEYLRQRAIRLSRKTQSSPQDDHR